MSSCATPWFLGGFVVATVRGCDDFASAANDPAFWRLVQKQFRLDPGLLYFNNASLGPSPALVADATEHYRQKFDAFPSRWMWGGWKEESIRRLENYNTRNLPEVLGLGVAFDFQQLMGPQRRSGRILTLKHYLRESLDDEPGLTITRVGRPQCPILELCERLNRKVLASRDGRIATPCEAIRPSHPPPRHDMSFL